VGHEHSPGARVKDPLDGRWSGTRTSGTVPRAEVMAMSVYAVSRLSMVCSRSITTKSNPAAAAISAVSGAGILSQVPIGGRSPVLSNIMPAP
jgi:hypothetical protein